MTGLPGLWSATSSASRTKGERVSTARAVAEEGSRLTVIIAIDNTRKMNDRRLPPPSHHRDDEVKACLTIAKIPRFEPEIESVRHPVQELVPLVPTLGLTWVFARGPYRHIRGRWLRRRRWSL